MKISYIVIALALIGCSKAVAPAAAPAASSAAADASPAPVVSVDAAVKK